jgi:hypothetical protein
VNYRNKKSYELNISGVTLVNGLGVDKTKTAALSREANIGFMGPE